MLSQHFCQFPGVDTRNTGHLLTLEPVAKTFRGIPMAVIFGIITYDNGFGMDTLAFHECG